MAADDSLTTMFYVSLDKTCCASLGSDTIVFLGLAISQPGLGHLY